MSAFPKDFWQKFDKKLEEKLDKVLEEKLDKVLEEKLDKMLEEKLHKILDRKLDEKLDNKLDELNNKFDKLQRKVKEIGNWTKRQDKVLEGEMAIAMHNHFVNNFPGYVCVEPHKKVIGRVVQDNATGLVVTDFDGLVVLTNDVEYAKLIKGESNTFTKPKSGFKAYMIILEAKQHLTSLKVKHKIAQRAKIQQWKNSMPYLQFVDDFIGLYIGGAEPDPAASELIENLLKQYQDELFIGTLMFTGARFGCKDKRNDFGRSVIIYGGDGQVR